jgi:hypothetical protein
MADHWFSRGRTAIRADPLTVGDVAGLWSAESDVNVSRSRFYPEPLRSAGPICGPATPRPQGRRRALVVRGQSPGEEAYLVAHAFPNSAVQGRVRRPVVLIVQILAAKYPNRLPELFDQMIADNARAETRNMRIMMPAIESSATRIRRLRPFEKLFAARSEDFDPDPRIQ